jgi:hypothetical protein
MLRRDITIVGANNSGTFFREPPPGGLSGPASGNRVNVLIRKTMSSLMPTGYDLTPETIFIDDNAPDQVEIALTGSPNAFERTNTGFNLLEESLFESEQ